MANICINCKADLREAAKFCQVCGTKVTVKQRTKITQAKFCIKCGAPLKNGAKFCTKCKASTVKREASDLGKKALAKLLNQTISASDTAGEMRITMNDAQKSCLTDVIHEMTKMLGR
ncbi:MAG: zinc ribbon domain-containing protein [Bacteroidales bacterium]|jgi:predicted amidophosphoribosyltransferase|nr:zinc ribbon domain-containing protein [Bacteroidales bacterium]